jgi:hypothetical protein
MYHQLVTHTLHPHCSFVCPIFDFGLSFITEFVVLYIPLPEQTVGYFVPQYSEQFLHR